MVVIIASRGSQGQLQATVNHRNHFPMVLQANESVAPRFQIDCHSMLSSISASSKYLQMWAPCNLAALDRIHTNTISLRGWYTNHWVIALPNSSFCQCLSSHFSVLPIHCPRLSSARGLMLLSRRRVANQSCRGWRSGTGRHSLQLVTNTE